MSGRVTRGHDKMLSSDKLDKTKLLFCCWQISNTTETSVRKSSNFCPFPQRSLLDSFSLKWSDDFLHIMESCLCRYVKVSEASCGRHTVQKHTRTHKKYWPYRASLSVQLSVNISVQLMERLIYKAWTLPRYWFVEFPLYWTFRGWGEKKESWRIKSI